MLKTAAPGLDFDLDREQFISMGGKIDEQRPQIHDAHPVYAADGQYVLMNNWAFRRITADAPQKHTDIASQLGFLLILSNSVPVEFLDIRDPGVSAGSAFKWKYGDLLSLPKDDDSVESLSCLHVAEHVGLGRYGDRIDPDGFKKACQEMIRVLRPGGKLYFAVPMGIPKTVFNAHRVLSRHQILSEFANLHMLEFSCVTSSGRYLENCPAVALDNDPYGCGMFVFQKRG